MNYEPIKESLKMIDSAVGHSFEVSALKVHVLRRVHNLSPIEVAKMVGMSPLFVNLLAKEGGKRFAEARKRNPESVLGSLITACEDCATHGQQIRHAETLQRVSARMSFTAKAPHR